MSSTPDTGMKILVLSPWGSGSKYSGPVTFLQSLFSAVARAHPITVDIIGVSGSALGTPAWADQVWAPSTGKKAAFGRVQQVWWGIRAGVRLRLVRDRYDYIHLHGAYLPNLVAVALGAGRRTKFVVLPVLEDGDLRPSNAANRWLLQRLMERTHVGLSLSRGIEQEFHALGLSPDRVRPIGNSVTVESFASADKRAAPSAQRMRLGFVGKVGPIKRPDLVIDATKALRDKGIDAIAVIVGPAATAAYSVELEERIVRCGITDSVAILGFREDISALLLDSVDIFVLPSSSEGMPGALAEAMVAGLPSIVTDVGAMGAHLRASSSGFVIEPSAEAIVSAVEALVSDPGLWATCSANASAYGAEHFGSSVVAQQYGDSIGMSSRAPTGIGIERKDQLT